MCSAAGAEVAVADAEIGPRAGLPVVEGKDRLLGDEIVDLHGAVAVFGIHDLVAEIPDGVGGVGNLGRVERTVVVREELDIAGEARCR